MSLIQVEQALLKCCQEHRTVNITCQFLPMALPSNKWDVKIFICPTINIYRRVTFGTLVAAKPFWTSLPRSNGSTVWYLLSRYKLSEQNLYYYFHTSNTTFSKETQIISNEKVQKRTQVNTDFCHCIVVFFVQLICAWTSGVFSTCEKTKNLHSCS